MAPTNHWVDQKTFSEHLRTIALPAKRAAMIGDQELCSAGIVLVLALRARKCTERQTVVPGNDASDDTEGLIVDL
jgi:hypothetical protein